MKFDDGSAGSDDWIGLKLSRFEFYAVHGFAFADQAAGAEGEKFNGANAFAVDLGDVNDGDAISVAEDVIESEAEGLDAGEAARPILPQVRFAYDARRADDRLGARRGEDHVVAEVGENGFHVFAIPGRDPAFDESSGGLWIESVHWHFRTWSLR